jgi:hypothetical protein
VYKSYNKAGSNAPFRPAQTTKYDHLKGYTIARKNNPNPEATQNFPRPHLNSLGAIRPPDGWNPVTQKVEKPLNTMKQLNDDREMVRQLP